MDITHLLDNEQGSAFDQDSVMFASFNDGAVFDYANADYIRETKDMLKVDAKAQTLEQVLSLPIRQAPWSIQRGRSSEAVHKRITELLTQPANAGGMTTPMNTVIAQMCNAMIYKKAFFEKVWTESMGGVGYKKVAWRPPGTCTVQRDPDTGAFRGFRQMPIKMDATEEKVFEPERAFVYIHGSHRDPLEGVSDLEITRWCYQTKQKIRFLWYSFLEGQSLPKTVVKATDETEAQNAAKKLVGLRQGGIVGLSDRISTDVLESSGRGAAEFKAAMQWLDAEASSSVLAGFTDLGAAATSGIGSFALSKDQTDFFLMSRQAVSREMQDFINQYLIADLVMWNFGPNEVPPTFEFGPIAQDDAQMAVNLLTATAQLPLEQSALPREFFAELVERVSGFLELDIQTVRNGLERAKVEAEKRAAAVPNASPTAPAVAGVKAAVDKATNAIQGARSGADQSRVLASIA